jgi:hypothetical protein
MYYNVLNVIMDITYAHYALCIMPLWVIWHCFGRFF